MWKLVFSVLLALPSLSVSAADLVFRNGDVYTVDATRSWASAVAIEGNQIVYVGGEEGVQSFINKDTDVIDLDGRMLLPGFHDGHLHPMGGGEALSKLALDGVYDREDLFSRIQTYAEANPELPWVLGQGWIEAPFLPAGVPNRQMLDRLVPDRPAFFYNASHHQAWANSKALEIAGITAATPDPENGVIDREEDGTPSGSLHESAMDLVRTHVPEMTDQDRLASVGRALDTMARYGITAFMDAGSSPESERAFSTLHNQGAVTARAVLCQRFHAEIDDETQIAAMLVRRQQLDHEFLRATCVKLMLDGIVEHHTSALLEPYADKPESRGMIFMQPDQVNRVVEKLDALGFQIHVHSIADRSTRVALDAFENAIRVNGFRDARPTQAHLQLVNPADIPRFRALGVIPNISPIWMRLDFWEQMAIDAIGPERGAQLFNAQDYLRHGGNLVWGTDWSVTSLAPLEGIETAVTRRHLGGVNPGNMQTDKTWMPDQTLNLEQAIAAYTIQGAYLMHMEDKTGSIEVGKFADLVVLEENLFEIPALEIHSVNTDLTVFDGQIIYRRQ